MKFRTRLLGGVARKSNAPKTAAYQLCAIASLGLALIFTLTLTAHAQVRKLKDFEPPAVRQTAGPKKNIEPPAVLQTAGPTKNFEPAVVFQPSSVNKDFEPPFVFQAAGPNVASIQSTVDAFRAALGNPNNGNSGPLDTGHREINWDGAGGLDTSTTTPVTPFNVFLNTRGSQFTTPGIGLTQAPAAGGPQGGLAVLFNNLSYGTIFKPFSNQRLFTPVGSNVTDALFFRPGSNGSVQATVTGFGAVFTDVDQPDGSGPGTKHGNRGATTLIEFFGVDGQLLFSSFVPASPGDGGLSFFGIMFSDARIASVRIITGDTAPGPDDDDKADIVVMDDFIYGEPRALP